MAGEAHHDETTAAPVADAAAPEREMPRGRRFAKPDADSELAELRRTVAEQDKRIASLEASVKRLADALGRADALLPVATPEQIRATYEAGGRFKVLAPLNRGDMTLQAGRVIEARHYHVDRLCDLAKVGLLRLAVVPRAA